MLRLHLRNVFLVLLFCTLTSASFNTTAQTVESKKSSNELRLDSNSSVSVKHFDKAKIDDLKQQRDFQYDTEIEEVSLWSRFWSWFWRSFGNLLGDAATNSISKYVFISLGVAIVGYILYKIMGAEALFIKKSKETFLPYDVLNDNIHEIDYAKELATLVSAGNYRLAVRLLYLQALKTLTDKEIIDWRPEKTNYNYLMEIKEPILKAEFGNLTYQFDRIWYGDFPVDGAQFKPISETFSHFNAQIK